jgi:hypothetical protein
MGKKNYKRALMFYIMINAFLFLIYHSFIGLHLAGEMESDYNHLIIVSNVKYSSIGALLGIIPTALTMLISHFFSKKDKRANLLMGLSTSTFIVISYSVFTWYISEFNNWPIPVR